jgi:N-glycosidase YbiA
MNEIRFWKIRDRETGALFPFWQFSNFASFSFEENGKKYKTSEHYYQSKKALSLEDELKVLNAPGAGEAAKTGRTISMRADWEEIKEGVMFRALVLKFTAHPELKTLLLSTGDATIIEDSPKDSYWGIGADGKGKSRLGYLLMKLREEIKGGKL